MRLPAIRTSAALSALAPTLCVGACLWTLCVPPGLLTGRGATTVRAHAERGHQEAASPRPGSAAALALAQPRTRPDAGRVVIPFDFESKFDGGAYGQSVGEMFWKKLQRQGGFVLPEAMLEVREWCQAHAFAPGPDTPLEKMCEVVRKHQAGDVGIWGKVERAGGAEGDIYDLWIYIADFSVEPHRMICKRKVRTKTAAEIPHRYVKEAIEALCGKAVAAEGTDPDAEERWAKAPNLVQGDFEKGRGAPAGWDPLPAHVRWVREDGKPGNRILRFTVPPDVAESTGVLYYSDCFPVQPGARYRFQCRWKTSGSAVKVFIKCYDEVPGKFRTGEGTQRREVYRSQQNLSGPAGAWNLQAEDFTPQHAQYRPRWGRVMLYAYYPAGTVEWDDVVIKQIAPPREAGARKEASPGDRP